MEKHDPEHVDSAQRRTAQAPYTTSHPVPTVQKYYKEQEERRQLESSGPPGEDDDGTVDKIKRKLHFTSQDSASSKPPYEAENRNAKVPPQPTGEAGKETRQWEGEQNSGQLRQQGPGDAEDGDEDGDEDPKDTTEHHAGGGDARTKRKAMKKRQPKGTRQVTDPVTHLPVSIHDFTGKELQSVPENHGAPGSHPRSDTSPDKPEEEIEKEKAELAEGDRGTRKVFPPPSFDAIREKVIRVSVKAVAVWTASMAGLLAVSIPLIWGSAAWLRDGGHAWYLIAAPGVLVGIFAVGSIVLSGLFLRTWLTNHVEESWNEEVWQAARNEETEQVEAPVPESTQWLNRLLASVWPLVNPDLFTSISDMIEDVMQASLPRFIRMVAVEDFGQGTEAVRILGIRWLPTGAAAKSVDVEGHIKSKSEEETNDRKVQGEGEAEKQDAGSDDRQAGNTNSAKDQDNGDDEGQNKAQDDENVAEGLEKEEGEFVNMEVAFAYRATSTDKRLSKKSKNAHLLIKFYLPGSLPVPIWVTLQGIVGVMRMRLQLTPDPPFVSLATITLIGQPKAQMQAIPLTRHFLNVMDLPFISGFVQSSIDAALAEYVAPRSLTLNLKEMLMGDDFKKDTIARGVLMVRIHRAYDFKQADPGIPGIKPGSADPYITVGWAKFGKPVWSTRVILETMHPAWEECAFLLVTPEELNAGERLRVQLWDSDRMTADDDVGRIEVGLQELMHNKQSHNNLWRRKDGFIAMKADEKMPGCLEWSVGYFPKVKLTNKQIKQQTALPKIKDRAALSKFVDEEANRKMREASERDMSDEIDQNKEAGRNEREVEMIAASPPPDGFPTGILSIQLHNITGLNLQVLRKSRDDTRNDGATASEVSDDLPSAFATVIINGQKVFKTRTKPKNSKPFFNASTERVLRDWRTTEVMISVRDARVHEDDALVGLVHLRLGDLFRRRAQVNATYPLVGGIGFGRFRISLMFRACELTMPTELLGWEYGTLEIGRARSDDLQEDLRGMRIKVKGPINKGKLHAGGGGDSSEWTGKQGGHIRLGTRNRYSSCVTFEFRSSVAASSDKKTAGFGVFWLKDLADSEAKVVEVPVWRGHRDKAFYKARTHCLGEEEYEVERAGTLKVDMKHWPGLSEYHRVLGKKNAAMRDVFEVMDTARDNLEMEGSGESKKKSDESKANGHAHDDHADDDSDPDSSTANFSDKDDEDASEDEAGSAADFPSPHDDPAAISLQDSRPPQEAASNNTGDNGDGDDDSQTDGHRGPLEQIRDFKHHASVLHRQHRGAMQWKAPRTVKWAKHKAESVKDKVAGLVGHHDREPDVETEV